MRRIAIVATILTALTTPAWAVELTVVNKSDYVIKELYVAPSKSKKWGSEQLREHAIGKDQSFTLRNIPAGVYDIKVVDEDDDSCVASNITFGEKDKEWTLTNVIIEQCEGDD